MMRDFPQKRLFALVAALVCGVLLFMFFKPGGNWGFLLPFRAQKLLLMCLVGSAIAVSTIVFQTLTANRILTPSIIGLDALYLLSKMVVIFFFGSAAHIEQPALWQFFIDAALMTACATLMFGYFLPRLSGDIYRLLLLGIIFGVLCSKLTDFMIRMIDPTEYSYFQGIAYARFDRMRGELLIPAGLIILACGAWLWHKRHILDIIALGRDTAISLGVNYRREISVLMMTVAMLVAISTALVGPVLFFGLLVSALTYRLFATPHHAILLPAAAMLAVLILVVGQTLFERVFGFASTLSIIIEGVGGIIFLLLLLSRKQS